MAIIKYYIGREETLELPNCFCGAEPVLVDRFKDVGNHKFRFVVIKCPYCHAHANEGRGYTSQPYHRAVEKAVEDWIKMIERI
jgi:hypothetical protein